MTSFRAIDSTLVGQYLIAVRPRRKVAQKRRKLGAYYTPTRLSNILSSWAIQHTADTILEPSFGGCGFLQSAKQRLMALGSRNPLTQIYGCDIDPGAFKHLARMLDGPVDLKRFVLDDFLNVERPSGWPNGFSVILGNPPYIPYQKLSRSRRNKLLHGATRIALTGRASLWAYFIGHALNYLSPGGRIALVLPGAFLQTYYAAPIREYFASSFRRAVAVVLRDRLFLDEGTDEETVVLLADGHGTRGDANGIDLREARNLEELFVISETFSEERAIQSKMTKRPASLSLHGDALRNFDLCMSNQSLATIGSLAQVKIGLVTGANEFFVQSAHGLKSNNLYKRDCKKILAKFRAAPGLTFDRSDHDAYIAEGGRGYLIDGSKQRSSRLRNYLRKFKVAQRKKVKTFNKRALWHSPDDGKIPDAFFPVMHHDGPRIVLNAARFNCTNTIHRVYFKGGVSTHQRMLASISVLTSFSQVSSELVGRRYGSGVLKHEPREAEKICLLLPAVSNAEVLSCYRKIDKLLRKRQLASATTLADELVFNGAGLHDWETISASFSATLKDMRERRRPDRSAS